MGMYTELHFNAELKADTPDEVLAVLRYMVREEDMVAPPTPDHELFTKTRWHMMLRGDSYYFDADAHSTVRYDDIGGTHYLCIRCNIKNYSDEIELFVGWITPYLEKAEGDFLGFMRYEETEWPTLIHHPNRMTPTSSLGGDNQR